MNKYQPGFRQRDPVLDEALSRLNRGTGRSREEPEDEPAFDLRSMLGLVRRQKWTIITTIILGLGLGALYVSQVERQYTATALMQGNNIQSTLLGLNDNIADIATEIEFIRSEGVLQRAAGTLELPASPVFDPRPSRLDGLLGLVGLGPDTEEVLTEDPAWETLTESNRIEWSRRLGDHLQVGQRGVANVITISATTPVPGASSRWANAVAEAYIQEQVVVKQRAYQAAIAPLREGVAALEAEVENLQVTLDPIYNAIEDRAALRETLAAETDAERQAAIRADVLALEDQIRQLAGQNEVDLDLRLTEQLEEQDLPADIAANVLALQRDEAVAQTNYEDRLTQLRGLQQDANLLLPEWTVISQAVTPTEPSYPSVRSTLIMALLLSAAAGFGLALARENWIGGIGDVEQMEQSLGIPILTAVPKYKGKRDIPPDWAIVDEPLSAFSESIRRARIGIESIMADQPIKLVVTSAIPGEGKTTLALSLARSLARAGRATILIDADLRHPNVHLHTEGRTQSGLVDYLLHGRDGSHLIVTREEASDLTLILGSEPSPVATDGLLLSERFNKVVDYAAREFDCVVFDSPPVGLVVDAHVLAQHHANVGLFVTKSESTSHRVAQSALREFQMHTDIPVVGLLNQTTGRSRYYGKYAGYYY